MYFIYLLLIACWCTKIHLLTKIIFHIFNIGLILLYLYPGSILGWLIYKDFKKSKFETYLSEIGIVISEIDLTLKNLKKWSKTKRVLPSILNFPSSDFIYSEPYGNVLKNNTYPLSVSAERIVQAIEIQLLAELLVVI